MRIGVWAVPMVLAMAGLLLTACAELELASHTAKTQKRDAPPTLIRKPSEPIPVGYKLGKPYNVAGVWYAPYHSSKYDQTGIASWYGDEFHGRPTASGEIFNMNAVSAAHQTMPLPSIAHVTNLENGRAIHVRVNDRGPFVNGRIIDLSRRSAQLLGVYGKGTAKVRVQFVDFAPLDQPGVPERPKTQLVRATNPAKTPPAATLANNSAAKTLGVKTPPPSKHASVAVEELTPPAPKPKKSGGLLSAQAAEQPDRGLNGKDLAAEGIEMVSLGSSSADMFIQVGSFSDPANAVRLSQRLARLGSISISSASVGGREYHRVRLGPVASVDEGDRLLMRLIKAGFSDARLIVAQ